jgi:hypothetical protein
LRCTVRVTRTIAFLLSLCVTGCTVATGNREPRTFDPDSVPEAFARSTAALLWPGATRAWQITPEGGFYAGEWKVDFEPTGDGLAAPDPQVIAFEDRWLPVAHWRRTSGNVRWDFEAVALPGPARWDDPAQRESSLVASVLVRATNTGSTACAAQLVVRLGHPGAPAFVAFDAPEPPHENLRWGGGASPDTVAGWLAERTDAGSMGPVAGFRWPLGPGATHELRLLLPSYATTARALAGWARTSHAGRVAETRRFWRGEAERGARFHLGDPEVETALEAARIILLGLRERRGEAWVPIGNPFQYRDVWLRDGARAIRALAVLGYTAEARACCAGLEQLQWPQGAFVSQRGQLDGTGQALWAFEQALLRPTPDDSLARFATAAERAWRWIEWQRALGRRTGWEFGALLPFGDPRDAELVRAQLVGNDAWAIAGYRATARLLTAAGREAQAAEVERSRAGYIADFLRALAGAPARGGIGARDVPPSWQGPGRDWGNLAVAQPCAVLPAGDPRVAALAHRIWAAGGGTGLASYGPADTAQCYVGADLGTWALLAGERAAADSVLEALLRWRTASGGGAELFSRSSRDFGANLPPHGTTAAALASLVRDALVFDEGDTLRLTLGARRRWWSGAALEGAPTRWGLLDLHFRRHGDVAEWRWSGVPVWTELTLPSGTRLAGDPPAPLARGRSDRVVLAPPGTRNAAARLAEAGR